jgi:hypothetical protein
MIFLSQQTPAPTSHSVVVLLFILIPVLSQAAIRLEDPQIPDSDKVVYRVSDDDAEPFTITENVAHINENGTPVYLITSTSRESDHITKLRRSDFTAFYASITYRYNGATVNRTNKLVENRTQLKEDELALMDYMSIAISLRGFPFANVREANLILLGVKNNMPLRVQVKDRENKKVGNVDVDCYRLELGITGVLGRLFPKSKYWYSVKPPHYLVRFEGFVSGPGSPKRVMEMTAWPKDYLNR